MVFSDLSSNLVFLEIHNSELLFLSTTELLEVILENVAHLHISQSLQIVLLEQKKINPVLAHIFIVNKLKNSQN